MDGNTYLAYDYPLLGAFWTMMWIFFWVLWLFLLFRIILDIFRDDALSGWGKVGWLVLVIIFPLIGVFVYLLARGKGMGNREVRHARAQRQAFNAHVREVAAGTDDVDKLAKLSEIRARGDISEEEFRRAKEKILH